MKFSNVKPISIDTALLVLRLGFGLLLAYNHGLGKLESFFKDSSAFYNFMGLGPEISFALAIFAELVCALAVSVGLFTRYALIPLIITFIVAVFSVHATDSLSDKEHPMLFLLVFVALFLSGPGKYSIDSKFIK